MVWLHFVTSWSAWRRSSCCLPCKLSSLPSFRMSHQLDRDSPLWLIEVELKCSSGDQWVSNFEHRSTLRTLYELLPPTICSTISWKIVNMLSLSLHPTRDTSLSVKLCDLIFNCSLDTHSSVLQDTNFLKRMHWHWGVFSIAKLSSSF